MVDNLDVGTVVVVGNVTAVALCDPIVELGRLEVSEFSKHTCQFHYTD